MPASCTIEDCDQPLLARGWCRQHYNRWHYAGDPAPWKSPPTMCADCAGPLPPAATNGPPATYCSRACSSRASYRRRSEVVRERKRLASLESRPAKACPSCGETFKSEQTARQIYCSAKCSKRMQNAGRRAKVRGAFVENLHWRMLFDEDGPACHVCGYDTDPDDFEMSASGFRTCGPSYPTLDHVIALAVGGLHERANAKLAHFYCNSVKGARALVAV